MNDSQATEKKASAQAKYDTAKIKRLSVFFHDARQRYLKPPWPHRQDTVLISPHDAPFASYGYGYNDAVGTDKPLEQGTVRPFFARRVDLGIDWALKQFGADPARVSVGGRGYWGGTAALQYGLKRPGKVAYVLAGNNPDPDPQQTPVTFKMYLWRDGERPRPTPIGQIEAVWGKRADWIDYWGTVDGKVIGMMGDLKRGRTVRSLSRLMRHYDGFLKKGRLRGRPQARTRA